MSLVIYGTYIADVKISQLKKLYVICMSVILFELGEGIILILGKKLEPDFIVLLQHFH